MKARIDFPSEWINKEEFSGLIKYFENIILLIEKGKDIGGIVFPIIKDNNGELLVKLIIEE